MAAIESKASVIPENNCEDAPPSYHSSTVTGVPYTKPGNSVEGIITTWLHYWEFIVQLATTVKQISIHWRAKYIVRASIDAQICVMY